jgi:inorganic triphosphatase YgiF
VCVGAGNVSDVVSTHRERETKFDVDAAFRLPNLTDLAGEDGWVEASIARLDSTYFDTPDHALLTRRVTLRRREGDIDNGWHLKVPAGPARTEIQLPLQAEHSAQDVPARLRELVAGLALGQSLRPVA